jgi:hypothetical protein
MTTRGRAGRTGRHAGHGPHRLAKRADNLLIPSGSPISAATIAQLFARAHIVLAALKAAGEL